jgi:hypothetical protein
MTPFEYIIGIMLLIIGLGVTQLLSKLVNRIRMRHEAKLHWIPLAWVLIVFLYQMEFLWSAFQYNSLIETWTPTTFFILLVYALLLFLAGVLVSPRANVEKNDHAFNSFLREGRWALIVLACYHSWGFLFNSLIYDAKFFNQTTLFLLIGVIILIPTFFGRSKLNWTIGTLFFAIYMIVGGILQWSVQYE